jgi:cytochrome P450
MLSRNVAGVPPGPRGTWLGGHLADFRRDRLAFLLRTAREFGDVVSLRLGPHRIILLSHPSLIEEVLVTQARHFTKHFALRINPLVLGKGLLTSEGDLWLRQRRLIQPAFQRTRMAHYGSCMPAYTNRLVDSWQDGGARDIVPEMMLLTLQIAAKILFDAEVTDEARAVGEALTLLQESFLSRFNSLVPPPLWLPVPANLRLRRAVRRLDEILYGFIRRRRQSDEDRGDLLSLLLHARDEDDRTGMTDRQVRDEAMTLFLAGHETTALSLSWAWFLLAAHPEAEKRLHAEVDDVLAGRVATVEDLQRLRFTEAVILEAMRLYPPAYVIGREAIHECEVAGYRVSRGTTILMSQWVVHRDSRFFGSPEMFLPERWLGDEAKQLPKYAYFPFGGGPRLCIGNNLAMMEAVLVLATLTQRIRFMLRPGKTVEPWPTFTLRPRNGVPVVLEFRK